MLRVAFVFNFSILILNLPRCSSYDESRLDDSSFHLAFRNSPFHLINKYVRSLAAYLASSLFHGGEHRVAGYGTLSVGESADADVVGHL